MLGAYRFRRSFPWTAERIDELTKLWLDGQSARQIAKAFSAYGPITRNAVIGKVHRIGVIRDAGLTEHIKRSSTIASNRHRAQKRLGHDVHAIPGAPRPKPAPKPKKAPAAPKPEPSILFKVGQYGHLPVMDAVMPIDAAPVSFLLRGPCQCSWSIGPADQPETAESLVCGARAEEGRPYCSTHTLRAQRPGGKPFRATDEFLDQLDKALMRANALKMRSAA